MSGQNLDPLLCCFKTNLFMISYHQITTNRHRRRNDPLCVNWCAKPYTVTRVFCRSIFKRYLAHF